MSRLLLPGTVDDMVSAIADGYRKGRGFRVVNFHATPSYRAEEFRRQMAVYAERYSPITPANFDAAFDGQAIGPKPGLMPVLFEGFRDNLDVMLPILEQFGFVGWLFIPSFFLDVPADEQRSFAAQHSLHPALREEYSGERMALTWDEARAIAARGHGFACHSGNHVELLRDSDTAFLQREITRAKEVMERELGQAVDIFCWLRGAGLGIHPEADRILADSGFRYLFSNFQIQKVR